MNVPLVSAVISAYNSERFLAAALDSVFAQDYRPIEVIVVDDGSTDNTRSIAEAYDPVQYIHQQNQGRPGATRNTGVRAATGELLAFLDADDLWLPRKLSTQVNYLLEHLEVGLLFTLMRVVLEEGVGWPRYLNRERHAGEPICYLPSAWMVRRAVFDTVGYFDSTYRTADDWDWILRTREAAIRAAVIPEILVEKRIHSSNLCYEVTAVEHLALFRTSVQRKRQVG